MTYKIKDKKVFIEVFTQYLKRNQSLSSYRVLEAKSSNASVLSALVSDIVN